jgi:hypothetical protein
MAGILSVIFCVFIVAALSAGKPADWRFLLTFGSIVAGNVVVVLRMREARRKVSAWRGDAAQQ